MTTIMTNTNSHLMRAMRRGNTDGCARIMARGLGALRAQWADEVEAHMVAVALAAAHGVGADHAIISWLNDQFARAGGVDAIVMGDRWDSESPLRPLKDSIVFVSGRTSRARDLWWEFLDWAIADKSNGILRHIPTDAKIYARCEAITAHCRSALGGDDVAAMTSMAELAPDDNHELQFRMGAEDLRSYQYQAAKACAAVAQWAAGFETAERVLDQISYVYGDLNERMDTGNISAFDDGCKRGETIAARKFAKILYSR